MAARLNQNGRGPGEEYNPPFKLPESPDAKEYQEVLRAIEVGDVDESAADFRVWCCADFWFFCRYCLTFGDFICDDPYNKWYGKRWADHPWVFDRCRELQLDPTDPPVFRKWARFHLKTSLITVNHTLWDSVLHSDDTGCYVNTLLLTYKVDSTGENFIFGIKSEAEGNEKLKSHFPGVFYGDPRGQKDGSPLWTSTAIRFKQPPGMRDPSVLVAGLINMPTSGHYSRIKIDDAVTQETITNQDQIDKTFSAMRHTSPLGASRTIRFYTGTNWRVGDPWELGLRAGLYVESHQDCLGPMSEPDAKKRKEPVLMSQHWINEKRRELAPYDFACQLRGTPVAESEQNFKAEWWQTYYSDPYADRKNGNVYIIIDPSRSKKASSDFYAISVLRYGHDRKKYVLDMYRDRYDVDEFMDLLFYLVGDPNVTRRPNWGHGGWGPKAVFEEINGADRDVMHIKREMETRSFRFRIDELPHDRMPKEDRIRALQAEMAAKMWFLPPRVGHGPKGDHRDTVDVFKTDEYQLWTPEGGAMHDDMLDCLAHTARPKMKNLLIFPGRVEPRETEDPYRAAQRKKHLARRHTSWAA